MIKKVITIVAICFLWIATLLGVSSVQAPIACEFEYTTAATYQIQGDALELRTADDAIAATFQAAN